MRTILKILLFSPFLVFGQQRGSSTMKFEGGEAWNFGEIHETAGIVEHTFVFRNNGTRAFTIESVSVDCGCTTPSFSRDPVAPGKLGEIRVRFDPKNQEGPFEKQLRVLSNGGNNRNTITVKGSVVPRPRSVEEDFPFVLGSGVRMAHLTLNFGWVEQGAAKEIRVGVVNTSDKQVMLSALEQPERDVLRVVVPPVLPAGAKDEIVVAYDLTETTFYGRYSDRIYLSVDGVRQMLPLSTTFTAVDAFRQGAAAAEAMIAPLFFNHGSAKRGEKLTRALEIANDGTAPLEVRWVGLRDGMTTNLRVGTTVGPRSSRTFTVTMDTAGMDDGVQTGAVTIITNDPVRPVREIRSAAMIHR